MLGNNRIKRQCWSCGKLLFRIDNTGVMTKCDAWEYWYMARPSHTGQGWDPGTACAAWAHRRKHALQP